MIKVIISLVKEKFKRDGKRNMEKSENRRKIIQVNSINL